MSPQVSIAAVPSADQVADTGIRAILGQMKTEKRDALEVLWSNIRAARSELEGLLRGTGDAAGDGTDRLGLRAKVEEKLTELLFEFIDLTEARFHVAV